MHLHIRNSTYIYRRRIPKSLKPFMQMTEFKRHLVSDLDSSQLLASHYDMLFSKLKVYAKLNLDVTPIIKELNLSEDTQMETPEPVDIYAEFLNSKQNLAASSYNEYNQQLELIKVLLPLDLKSLSYRHLDSMKQTLSHLPKRNIQKYRDMSLKEVIKVETAGGERISIKSQNEYLKTLRALLKFAKERNYIMETFTIELLKNRTAARNQRQLLNKKDMELLFNHEDQRMVDMAKILYYSGMRLSEVYKCSINRIDNVLCFDLSDILIELKTESSRRIIPVHKDIEDDVHRLLNSATSIKGNRHSRMASEALNQKNKTLYSLRHTFATELASKNIEPNLISELLGHVHQSMTLNRYIKGFPVKLLKDAIDKLEIT